MAQHAILQQHLLLFRRDSDVQPPSESVIMEIQQRSDLKVFRQHYYHCDETAVRDCSISFLLDEGPLTWFVVSGPMLGSLVF